MEAEKILSLLVLSLLLNTLCVGFRHHMSKENALSSTSNNIQRANELHMKNFNQETQNEENQVTPQANPTAPFPIINGHGTGLKLPTQNELENLQQPFPLLKSNNLNNTALSTAVDLSEKPYFPPIGNQGSEGSCTAWALGYYTKTFQEAKEQGWFISSTEEAFSPDFIYHQINGGGDHGSSIVDAMNLILEVGACKWPRMPYDATDSTSFPSENAFREAPLYRGKGGGYYELNSSTGITQLKDRLADGQLATIMVDGQQLSTLKEVHGEDIWTTDTLNKEKPNHAEVIVGYNDSLQYPEGGGSDQGAFRVVNSWGTGWQGDHNRDGKYWISYDAIREKLYYPLAFYYNDRQGYNPNLLSAFRIAHPSREEIYITVGKGTTATPMETKSMYSYLYQRSGPLPFPSHPIVLDITELNGDGMIKDLYLNITDLGGTTTGNIYTFWVESYAGGYRRTASPNKIYGSPTPPVSTQQGKSVFLEDLKADTTPPFLTITNPRDDAIIEAQEFLVRWNGSDNEVGIAFYEVRIGDGGWVNVGGAEEREVNLKDGKYSLAVRAIDGTGKMTIASVQNVTIDTSPPSLEIFSPNSGKTFETNEVTVRWRGGDNGTGIDSYKVRIDTSKWKRVGEKTSYEVTGLNDGKHKIAVKAVDGTKKTETKSITLTINTSPIGGPGLLEESTIGIGVGGVIVAIAVVLYFKKVK